MDQENQNPEKQAPEISFDAPTPEQTPSPDAPAQTGEKTPMGPIVGIVIIIGLLLFLFRPRRTEYEKLKRIIYRAKNSFQKEDIAKCAELGIGITLQPSFLVSPLEPTSYLKEILGDRVDGSSPLRSIIDAGVHMSGGSDGPVTHPDPIEGIYGACNHPYDPKQSVTIAEALKMYTYEIAWTSFDEKERGSLEVGKIADLVILNQNPLALQPKELRKLKVERLLLNGVPYKSGMSIGSMLWHAIRGRKKLI